MNISFNSVKNSILNAVSTVVDSLGNLGGRIVTAIRTYPATLRTSRPVQAVSFAVANMGLIALAHKISSVVELKLAEEKPSFARKVVNNVTQVAVPGTIVYAGNYALNRVAGSPFSQAMLAAITTAGVVGKFVIQYINNSNVSVAGDDVDEDGGAGADAKGKEEDKPAAAAAADAAGAATASASAIVRKDAKVLSDAEQAAAAAEAAAPAAVDAEAAKLKEKEAAAKLAADQQKLAKAVTADEEAAAKLEAGKKK